MSAQSSGGERAHHASLSTQASIPSDPVLSAVLREAI